MTVRPFLCAASLTACCDILGPIRNIISVETKRVSPTGGTPVKPRSPGSARRGRARRHVMRSRRCSATILWRSTKLAVTAMRLCTFWKFAALPLINLVVAEWPSALLANVVLGRPALLLMEFRPVPGKPLPSAALVPSLLLSRFGPVGFPGRPLPRAALVPSLLLSRFVPVGFPGRPLLTAVLVPSLLFAGLNEVPLGSVVLPERNRVSGCEPVAVKPFVPVWEFPKTCLAPVSGCLDVCFGTGRAALGRSAPFFLRTLVRLLGKSIAPALPVKPGPNMAMADMRRMAAPAWISRVDPFCVAPFCVGSWRPRGHMAQAPCIRAL